MPRRSNRRTNGARPQAVRKAKWQPPRPGGGARWVPQTTQLDRCTRCEALFTPGAGCDPGLCEACTNTPPLF